VGRPSEPPRLRLQSGFGLSSPVRHPIAEFRHEALLYAGWAAFIAGTVPFIRDGLEAREPVLVVESAEKIEMLRVALGGDAGEVLFADMTRVGANPARIIPAWHEFVTRNAAPGRRMRGIGEPIWGGRSSDELVECQRHEALLNLAFGRGEPWWLLCPYDVESLDPAVIDEARRSHEFVTDGRTDQRSDSFRGLDALGAPFSAPLPEPESVASRLAFGAADLDSLREMVSRQARAARLKASRAAELVIAVNEIATNSIRHGGGGGTLRIWHAPSAIVCEIRDKGRFDQPLVDRQRPSNDVAAPRGLWLANHLCDLVQIRTQHDGTVVRLHMNRLPASHLRVVPDIH
jgi:anti-sigma regulatory factor (Ser/Thr protein kinase)